MWIVPKTLSAFVPDTEGLNLDLEERAWMLESSAMWRSKPSSKQTWLRRLKKDAWMTRLSTRILKPSLHESFEEKYTASLEDIPVSRFQAQESEKERKTQDTCGPTSESMSGQLDLFGAFSKMSEVTPRWGYGESCPIWKKMVTERSGDCSQRRKQARLTNASDASSWPTATARDHKGCYKTLVRKDGKPRGDLLPDAVNIAEKRWLTPTTTDIVRSPEGMEKRKQYRESIGRKYVEGCLSEQVDNQLNWPTPRAGNPGSRKPGTGGKILAEEAKKNWPTPTAMSRPRSEETMEKCLKFRKSKGKNTVPLYLEEEIRIQEAKIHAGPPAPEKSSTSGKNHGSPKLNPNWVEQLMGLPIGWTQLPTEWTDCASSEMALSANVQK